MLSTSLVAVTGGPASAAAEPPRPVIEPIFSPQSGRTVWLDRGAEPRRAVMQPTAAAAARPTVPKGLGPVRNATELSFSLTDRLEMKVNVGSGNLLLTSTELTLPQISGNVTLGASFNSLLLGSEIPRGSLGPGWRSRSGADVRLYEADDDSVTYVAADGVTHTFTADGDGYDAPDEAKAGLKHNGDGWKLTEHSSGRELFFTASGLLDKTEDRNGNVTDYTWSGSQWTGVTSDKGIGSGRTVQVSYTDGKISRYRQTGSDNSWREVSYAYDSQGRLQTIQSATPRKVMFAYNSAGDLSRITTKPDTFVDITYDGRHRVTSVNQITDNTTGQGSMTRLAYPDDTHTKVADPRQDLSKPVADVPHTSYTLDDDKRVEKTIDPAGNERSDKYTSFGDVQTSQSPEGGTVTNTYGANAGESLTKSASPTGASASAAYANAASETNPTANFQPSSSIDTQGKSSSYTYNGAGNPASSENAMAAKAEVDYNDNGTVKSSTDPDNDDNPTTFSYDSGHQLNKVTAPTGNGLAVKTFTYDPYGRLRTMTQGPCTTTYTYSAEDRLMQTDYSGSGCPSTTSVKFDYGLTGNLISRIDASGSTTYEYDQLNRLRLRFAPNTPAQRYVPDPAGNLERLEDGRGATRYYYNSRNWLVRMDTAGGTRYNFAYDKNGNRTHEWFATNNENSTWALHTQTSYDDSDRVRRITATRNSAAPAKVFDTTYCYADYDQGSSCSADDEDDTGLRQWQRDEISGTVSEFSHDDANRLTKVTNWLGSTYEYAYDDNGNRTSVKRNSNTVESHDHNTANQITSTGNTYDSRGNQTRTTAPEIGTLSYNAASQMSSAYGPGGQADYTYAGTDQVELTRAGGLKLDYGMEDQYGMPWLQSWTNGANLTVYVERDGLGTPLGLRIGTADYVYVTDGLGSIVAVVGSNGAVAASYQYDPYGTVQAASNENGLPQTNLVRYAGGVYDPATRLTRFGQRWYNPNQGRFTQQDNLSFMGNPARGNRYAYAGDDPINHIDPTGQMAEGMKNILGGIGLLGGLFLAVAFSPLVVGATATAFAVTGIAMIAFAAGGFILGGMNDCERDQDC
jgi:RHS repeat-associated protein